MGCSDPIIVLSGRQPATASMLTAVHLMTSSHSEGQCGSCWAFGSTTAFTDRWCIAANQTQNPELSVQATLTCVTKNRGCLGGSNANGWDFFHDVGVPSAQCRPYTIQTCPGAKTYGHNPCWGPPLPGSPTSHPTPPCASGCTNKSVVGKYSVYRTTG